MQYSPSNAYSYSDKYNQWVQVDKWHIVMRHTFRPPCLKAVNLQKHTLKRHIIPVSLFRYLPVSLFQFLPSPLKAKLWVKKKHIPEPKVHAI